MPGLEGRTSQGRVCLCQVCAVPVPQIQKSPLVQQATPAVKGFSSSLEVVCDEVMPLAVEIPSCSVTCPAFCWALNTGGCRGKCWCVPSSFTGTKHPAGRDKLGKELSWIRSELRTFTVLTLALLPRSVFFLGLLLLILLL